MFYQLTIRIGIIGERHPSPEQPFEIHPIDQTIFVLDEFSTYQPIFSSNESRTKQTIRGRHPTNMLTNGNKY